MLCRLHKMTEQRYRAIAESQKALALGTINMDKADKIRNHLLLVYAIETQNKMVRDRFSVKNISLTAKVYKKIEEAKEEILVALRRLKSKIVPFSPRLERRAIQLACAMSLSSYFRTGDQHIRVDENALNFAIKFFVEEAVVRSQEKIDQEEILKRLKVEV